MNESSMQIHVARPCGPSQTPARPRAGEHVAVPPNVRRRRARQMWTTPTALPPLGGMMPAMTTLAEPPIWPPLPLPSLEALLSRDGNMPAAITFAPALDDVSVVEAPLLALTRFLIQRAQALGGLTLTATGALSRADVRAFFGEMTWPDYKANVLVMNKVLNEADVMPVEITRRISQDVTRAWPSSIVSGGASRLRCAAAVSLPIWSSSRSARAARWAASWPTRPSMPASRAASSGALSQARRSPFRTGSPR